MYDREMKFRMKTLYAVPASTSQTTLSPTEKPSISVSRLATPEDILFFSIGLPFVMDPTRQYTAAGNNTILLLFSGHLSRVFCQAVQILRCHTGEKQN